MTRFSILLLFLLASGLCPAQSKQTVPDLKARDSLHVSLTMQARYTGDSIVLRWGCNNAFAWRKLSGPGYWIERLELDAGNKPEPAFTRLTSTPVKPWSEVEWKQKGAGSDTYLQIAEKTLYGKEFSVHAGNNSANGQGTQQVKSLDQAAFQENQRFMVAMITGCFSQKAATALGLRYTDLKIRKNVKYIYRIYPAAISPLFKTDTAVFIIDTKTERFPAPVENLSAYEGDRIITLHWTDQEHYAGYYIERSEDGTTFAPVNKDPYIQFGSEKTANDNNITYNDTLPANYKTYYYRVKGISLFSELSKPSEIIKVNGLDRTPPEQPWLYQTVYKGVRNASIGWNPYTSVPDLMGFFIYHGESVNGPFTVLNKKILPPTARNFTDTTIVEGGMNYYIVAAVDTAGNIASSLPGYVVTPDNSPPVAPAGLKGKVDLKGVVAISWHPNPEKDIEGYRVYRSNAIDHTFSPVSATIPDTVFMDTITLKTLTRHVYYKVVAVDRNKNNSPYPQALELIRPDINPPVPPVISDYLSGDGSMTIRWVCSSSEDAVKQILFRKTKEQPEWKTIAELPQSVTTYNDTVVERGRWYEYCLEAVDSSGLHSEKSYPLNVKVFDSGIRPDVQEIKAENNPDGKSVNLTWKYTGRGEYWFVIYRSVNGKSRTSYRKINSTLHSFTDQGLEKGTYRYFIKAVYEDGGESAVTGPATIEFTPTK